MKEDNSRIQPINEQKEDYGKTANDIINIINKYKENKGEKNKNDR